MRKNFLLLSSAAAFALIIFFGCGGESNSTLSSKEIITKNNASDTIAHNKTKIDDKNLPLILDQILPVSVNSATFEKIYPIQPIQSDYATFEQITESIEQNHPVNLTLEYDNISADLYHANLKSNSKSIGQNFIYISPSGTEKEIELLTQILDAKFNILNSHYSQGYIKTHPIFNKIWNNPIGASIIIDSLKNNSFNALQNSKYTVNFTLQKTATQDLQFSNIKISGLNLPTDHFVLRADQFSSSITSLTLQSLLTTLFANFDKSKAIFN